MITVDVQDWITRGQQGDSKAFDRLKQQYEPKVQAYCCAILHHQQDAEDVVQETFLRAWRSLARYEARAPFDHWLCRIARNLCWNARRGIHGKLEWNLEDTALEIEDPHPTPEDIAAEEGFFACVWAKLKALLSLDALLLCRLYYQEGMTLSDAAVMLGKPKGTLNATLQRKIKPAVQKAGKECHEE